MLAFTPHNNQIEVELVRQWSSDDKRTIFATVKLPNGREVGATMRDLGSEGSRLVLDEEITPEAPDASQELKAPAFKQIAKGTTLAIDDNRRVSIHPGEKDFILVWENQGRESIVRISHEAADATARVLFAALSKLPCGADLEQLI